MRVVNEPVFDFRTDQEKIMDKLRSVKDPVRPKLTKTEERKKREKRVPMTKEVYDRLKASPEGFLSAGLDYKFSQTARTKEK